MKKLKRLIYRWIDQQFLDGCTSYNSLDVRKASRSKKSSRAMFSKLEIPHAQGKIFLSPFAAFDFVKEHGYPVVVKPNVSGFSRGSHFPIKTPAQLLKACLMVKIWWPFSVIERYLEGHNYRVVVIKDEVMGAIERYPAFVIGDGTSTVKQLIENENQTRQALQLLPAMYLLKQSQVDKNLLRQQQLELSSVPLNNQWVDLHNKVALKPGGIVETINPDKVHPDTQDACQRLLTGFDANILGIDIIMKDSIEKSYLEQECIFLEVNSRPYLKMHHHPRFGPKPDLESSYQKLDQLHIDDADIF